MIEPPTMSELLTVALKLEKAECLETAMAMRDVVADILFDPSADFGPPEFTLFLIDPDDLPSTE